MRGTIVAWKPDKGFGFIRPEGGGTDVFVHIRDFGNIARPPQVGDTVSYQPMKGEDGRLRAADAHIAGVPRLAQSKPKSRPHRKGQSADSPISKVVGGLVMVALASVAYTSYKERSTPARPHTIVEAQPETRGEAFTCAGKRHCSEMSSCAEATYYLRHCPNTEMDGDSDGIPCESQWCN